MYSNIRNGFHELIISEKQKDYFQKLVNFINDDRQSYEIYPQNSDIFRAFKFFALNDTRVVIIGQDPYHGEGEANGLAFSVNEGVKTPPSLRNIIKEIKRDINQDVERTTDFTDLAKQGVLLINSVLTVRKDTPTSHRKKGWETFTDTLIAEISSNCQSVVFMLWGKDAEKKKILIDEKKHKILITSHPSPFSARRGFDGCGHFTKANKYLKEHKKDTIKWC